MGEKGSLTAESCISFTFFISLFILLLFFIRLVSINLILDHAAVDTAKRIATTAYAISLAGNDENLCLDESEKLKNGITELAVRGMLSDYLEEHSIDEEKVEISFFHFPFGETIPDQNEAAKVQQKSGLIYSKDYTKDDVVLQLSYASGIKVPFFNYSGIVLVHTAVEKAWVHGSNGVITAKEEGLDLTNDNVVYITRYGRKYHQGFCRYLAKSKIPIGLSQAGILGYGACSVCKP